MDGNGRSPLQIDLTGAVVRPPTLIVGRSFKGSPCLTPTSSPSPRRVSPTVKTTRVAENGCSTPIKRSSSSRFSATCIVRSFLSSIFPGRRLLPWIIFIALWTLFGLHVQFNLFYMENLTPSNEEISAHIPVERRFMFSTDSDNDGEGSSSVSDPHDALPSKAAWNIHWVRRAFKGVGGPGEEAAAEELYSAAEEYHNVLEKKDGDETPKDDTPQDEGGNSFRTPELPWSLPRTSTQAKFSEQLRQGLDAVDDLPESSKDGPDWENAWNAAPAGNYTIGTLVGPFDELERSVLGLGPDESKHGFRCKTDSAFAKLVNGKSLVIVLHELSMTGVPLSMLELGTRMRSCGARVSAVVMNKQGGLFTELVARGIRVLQDRAYHSWTAAASADIVVVGSAACTSWVGQYLKFNTKGGARLVWWIMENRREYFDRAKFLLGRPRALLFLSETQAMMWREWSSQEGLSLAADTGVISVSVSEELASIAGLTNQSDAGIAEKWAKLRDEVRGAMGLEPNDVLVASLSSINPGKGQLLFLQAALMVVDHVENEGLAGLAHVETDSALEYRSRRTFLTGRQIFSLPERLNIFSIFSERGRPPTPPSVKDKHTGTSGKDRKSRGGDSKSLLGQGRSSRKSRLPVPKGKKSSLKQRGQNLVRKIVFRFRRKVEETERLDGSPRLRILIGSVGSKCNKAPYVEKITRLLDRNEHLARLTLSTPATIHVAPLYAAADVYVMNAQGIGETFGRVTVEAMAFGLPVLVTDAGGSKEIISRNVTGLLHPTGRAGVPVLAQHIRRLLDNKSAREQMGQKGRELVDKLYREDLMYEKLARKFKQVLDTADSS